MGYYFGLWARCLSDELKKKICNDCHVASPALVGEKKSHLSRSTEAGNAVWLPQRPTSDSEDRRWRCCSWGQTLTHSNAAEPTPPDRWNVKTGLAGVRLGGFVTCLRNNPTHTQKRNHKLAIERTIFMATHSTNSTLLTIHDMRNPTWTSAFAESDNQHALIVSSSAAQQHIRALSNSKGVCACVSRVSFL